MIKRKILLIIIIMIAVVAVVTLYFLNFTSIDAQKYGRGCRIEKVCVDLIGVDCNSNVDGPYYYIDRKTEKIISRCGGERATGSIPQDCPPKEWKCAVY